MGESTMGFLRQSLFHSHFFLLAFGFSISLHPIYKGTQTLLLCSSAFSTVGDNVWIQFNNDDCAWELFYAIPLDSSNNSTRQDSPLITTERFSPTLEDDSSSRLVSPQVPKYEPMTSSISFSASLELTPPERQEPCILSSQLDMGEDLYASTPSFLLDVIARLYAQWYLLYSSATPSWNPTVLSDNLLIDLPYQSEIAISLPLLDGPEFGRNLAAKLFSRPSSSVWMELVDQQSKQTLGWIPRETAQSLHFLDHPQFSVKEIDQV